MLLIGHAETLRHQGAEIAEPKANHPMLGKIRTSLDDGDKFLRLRLAKATRSAKDNIRREANVVRAVFANTRRSAAE